MGLSVNKLIFFGILLVFLSFSLSTCGEPVVNVESSYTNVEYSEDGKSITIYLDGSAPVPANRSLTKDLAIIGHDFFEVTFLYNTDDNPDNYIIAKAAWELGEPAGVNGVYRTATPGVNYKNIGIPATGQGSAVLFVGRKTDKTLLAVGTLSHIYDGNNTETANITTNTTKVSFDVNALKAGVAISYASSSFQTTPAQQVDEDGNLQSIFIGDKPFPIFKMAVGATVSATYTFGFSSATHPYSFYQNAIIYAGGAISWNVPPHYTLPSGEIDHADYEHQNHVEFIITTPATPNTPFLGIVNFSINTLAADKMICALAFEIPVYAVYRTQESINWKMKPGYNEYYKELDSGNSENGGAVLIGIGNIETVRGSNFFYIGEPIKYNNINPPYSLQFSLEGIELYYKLGLNVWNLTDKDDPRYPDYWKWSNLQFYYDANGDGQAADNEPMANPGPQLLPFGDVRIRVVYTPLSGDPVTLIFDVEVNNISSLIDIPYENRFVIAIKENLTDAINYAQNTAKQGNFLWVFCENLDIPTNSLTFSGDATIFIVSTVPGLKIGRGNSGTGHIEFPRNDYNITIYLGRWPFNEPAFAGGNVITDEKFWVNSRGTYGGGDTATLPPNNMFTRNTGTGTGTLTVKVFAGADVNYPDTLPATP